MNDFKQMDLKGKKVMALRSIIQSIAILVLIIAIIVVNKIWLDLFSKTAIKWVAIVGLLLVVLNIIVGVLVIARYRYLIFKYKLNNEVIIVRTGLWFIKTRQIPLFRIQNVDIHEGIIMRKYNLANVSLSTAGGNAEVKLITTQEANRIKQYIRDVTQESL